MNKIKQDVIQQRQRLSEAVEYALNESMQGADAAEVAINQSTGINISTLNGNTENIEFNNDGALAITVYRQQRVGSASTHDLSPTAIKQTVKAALDIMQYTSQDPFSGIGDKALMAFNAPDLDLFYPDTLNVDEAIAKALLTEKTALSHRQITGSDGCHYSSHYGIHVYGNSHGMLESYCASRYSLSCSVIGEHNGEMERNYAYTTARDSRDLWSPELVGEQAATRTIAHLGSRQIKTQKVPVLFSADIAGSLFGHLASAISGGAIYRESTFLLDAIGKTIFPTWLTIDEDPHILKGLASAPFDGEGTRTIKQNIIDAGQLQTYLLTTYSARKLGLHSTGHAGGIHNWIVSSNGGNLNAMIKQMDKGLLVTSLMGQGVNIITGDYSRGASGFWIENGEIQFPVSQITIAGNLKQMFTNIMAIGNDIETRGAIQTGSILIDNMSIAGE
jgi:PmbA protein